VQGGRHVISTWNPAVITRMRVESRMAPLKFSGVPRTIPRCSSGWFAR